MPAVMGCNNDGARLAAGTIFTMVGYTIRMGPAPPDPDG